ncbi:hypothetical protein N7516_000881 [Penicillium verrucosum]|uniref:uncharacterized protein n=1 Tax=Penicillium verrucosum TaxID=60171 RepID=UPI0025452DD7|nr:uncharacterized protein N7516_000881 [Penicillium verrucosum]KAJ5940713.1 hypothetical protein N7516_000881 [Penicillium verrucosum]
MASIGLEYLLSDSDSELEIVPESLPAVPSTNPEPITQSSSDPLTQEQDRSTQDVDVEENARGEVPKKQDNQFVE